MTIPVLKKEERNGVETSQYLQTLLEMTNRLTMAEETITETFDRKIDEAYYALQYRISTGALIVNRLETMSGEIYPLNHAK
ncbi:hypothetical protein [Lentibacillus saliphilus]|uniref:hypothetical protein n=1 Tax=Lentibacillus saliphilus TaxID=2737028 RepID=UPI001C30EC1E|nr:hypothetical protein [Lentibacillus saliphilus]